MTRNDGLFLKQCVESIINTVSIATTIYIIDNNSDSLEHHAVINDLVARFDNIKPILNKKNLWVLGLNDTIKKIKHIHQSKYFFLTDADIDFSHCKARPCWLSYLIQQLEKKCSYREVRYFIVLGLFTGKERTYFNIRARAEPLFRGA